MVVDVPRRWRWTIVGACGAVVLVLVFFVASAARDRPSASASAAPRASLVLAAAPMRHEAAAADVERAAPVDQPHAADEVQVCGGAWVRAQPDGSVDITDLAGTTQVLRSRERILHALRSSSSELARATALMLGTTEAAPAGDALARRALESTDARLYAMAFKVCSGRPGEGACRMLSAEQWARLDPHNAAPWQFVFAAAAARGDSAAQDDALFRMASARRSATDFYDAAAAVLDAMPDDDASALAAWTLVTAALGFQAAVSFPGLQPLTQACKVGELRDWNRVQTCASLAEMMVERSDTLLERMVGASIGKQAGWPAERLDRIRGEYRAYADQAWAPSPERHEYECASLRRDLARVRRHAALGEVGLLREWVAASGQAPEHFAAEGRARQRREAAVAAEAASTASGPAQAPKAAR